MDVELEESIGRSSVRMQTDKKKISLFIKSPDLAAFRASINNYLRLFNTITKVIQNVK